MGLSYIEAVARAEDYLRKSGLYNPLLTVKSVERGIDLWFVRFDEGSYGTPVYSLLVNMETGEVSLENLW